MSNHLSPEDAYLAAITLRSLHSNPEQQRQAQESMDLTKRATDVAKGAIDELSDMRQSMDELVALSTEAFQQRDWAMASLRELGAAYHLLQEEHSVTSEMLDTMTYANANSIKESLRSDNRNERHIAKLSREITFMQRKLNKRRNRINHLQEVIGNILQERPIVTDYDKMGGAVLGRIVHTLSEKYREVCRREKEEADARERLFKVDIKDSRKLVDALRKQGFNEDAIIEFMQVTKAVNNGQV